MNKLVTTAMVAVLGLFGAIENGTVTLVSSASAATVAQTAAAKSALRIRLNAIVSAQKSNDPESLAAATQALEHYLTNTPLAASLVADVLAIFPPSMQAAIAGSVGRAMGAVQQTLIANGSPAALQAAAELTQEVQQMPAAVQQAAVTSFQSAGGIQGYSTQGGNQGGGQGVGGNNQPAAQSLGGNSSAGAGAGGTGSGGGSGGRPSGS